MRFRRLAISCECGQSAKSLKSVGFTSEFELVVHWTCRACGKSAYLVKSLADCCKACPDPEVAEETDDARFLQSMGIRMD